MKSKSHKRKMKSRTANKKSKPRRKKSSRIKKVKSNSKGTWEKFLKNKDSADALKRSWKSKNPEEYYKNTIKRLAKKFSNT